MQPELEDWSIAASCTHMELQCPPASPPSCAIGDAGVASLVAALAASPQVVFVDLRRNKIGDAGAVALAGLLASANSTIATLLLGHNMIEFVGAEAIGTYNPTASTAP